MAELQESDYGLGRDYTHGSPHLAHASLRTTIETELRELVTEILLAKGFCRVVEVGAGHGVFTSTLRDAGATVTVTEMSGPSANVLRTRFGNDQGVRVVHDPSAELAAQEVAGGCDLVVFVSVLHHIPDYFDTVDRLVKLLDHGGAFYSTQDPIWYADRTWLGRKSSRFAYLLWRVRQGEFRRGFSTLRRRRKGVYDDTNPSDMVEYHVVRNGVNQNALVASLEPFFEEVTLRTFWTTQGPWLQRLGARLGLRSDFMLAARRRK